MPTLTTCDDRRPFLSAPNPNRYFAAAASEEARRRIVRSVARAEGPALIVGGVGVGKSLLLAVLAEQFLPRMSVVTLPGAQLCTRRALLQVILFELGLPYRGKDEGELRLSIVQHLRGSAATALPAAAEGSTRRRAEAADAPRSRRLLLLVDEADSLPIRLLEELRALTNIAADGAPLVSLVLAGSPILEERFADPQLEVFSQRIAARAYLAPMGREETFQYVRSQVAAVGLKPDLLFAADALEAIYAATGGVPRLVNQLGDQAMWMAEETGCVPLDGPLVQQAWSELQQLPAPWNTAGHGSATDATASAESGLDVVEFGELDDGDDHEVLDRGPAKYAALNADSDDGEDEMPASIPIGAFGVRDGDRLDGDIADFGLALDATKELLDSFDDAYEPEPTAEVALAKPVEPPATPLAFNPFDESFGEEEVLIDRYAEFDSLVRKAPQVRNRIDPDFAVELGRCHTGAATAMTTPAAKVAIAKSRAAAGEAPSKTPVIVEVTPVESKPVESAAEPTAALLIIDEDDAPTLVVPGRQFRSLFTRLASTGALA